LQEFFPLISTIFTTVKGTEDHETKIPLLFLEDDRDVDKWIKIEREYLQYKLPSNEERLPDPSKGVRKPLALNDFKTLYRLRVEDINFLAERVQSEEICVKSTKAKRKLGGLALVGLAEARAYERYIHAMKNEMMLHYRVKFFQVRSLNMFYIWTLNGWTSRQKGKLTVWTCSFGLTEPWQEMVTSIGSMVGRKD